MKLIGVLLAAGVGSRLLPYTTGIPKPLVPVEMGHGRIKVVIERLIEQAKAAGVTDFIVVVNYKKDAIMDYLGNGSRFGVNVYYCFQETLNGDAGGIFLSKDLLKERFLVLDADNYYEDELVFKKILDAHNKSGAIATVVTTKVTDTSKYAIMKLSPDFEVQDLVEKPMDNPKWTNMAKLGIFVFEPQALTKYDQSIAMREGGEFATTRFLKSLAEKGEKVKAVEISGFFTDIGTWDRYDELIAWINRKNSSKA